MKQQILAWLQGPRVYLEGVALYVEFGHNKVLKQNLQRGQSSALEQMLVHELGKLAGISDNEIARLPRMAETPKIAKKTPEQKKEKEKTLEDMILELADKLDVAVDDIFGLQMENEDMQNTIDELKVKYDQVPETTKKVIRLREKYPFLKSPDCPTELKVMVADMFSAYDNYREAYAALDPEKSDDENFLQAQAVVENYLSNREMWEELDYYAEHHTVLGKHPIFEELKLKEEIQAIADVDLRKKLANAKSNITKANNAIATAKSEDKLAEAQARLERWERYVKFVEAEIELRKK